MISSEEWLDKSSNEAIVIITDGKFEVVAFCQPYNYKVGDKLNEPLHLLDSKGFQKVVENEQLVIKRHNSGLEHEFCAILEDPVERVFSVNGIKLVVDDKIPSDLQSGDWVEFSCARVDLW